MYLQVERKTVDPDQLATHNISKLSMVKVYLQRCHLVLHLGEDLLQQSCIPAVD